jgi:hypothetical protein
MTSLVALPSLDSLLEQAEQGYKDTLGGMLATNPETGLPIQNPYAPPAPTPAPSSSSSPAKDYSQILK